MDRLTRSHDSRVPNSQTPFKVSILLFANCSYGQCCGLGFKKCQSGSQILQSNNPDLVFRPPAVANLFVGEKNKSQKREGVKGMIKMHNIYP